MGAFNYIILEVHHTPEAMALFKKNADINAKCRGPTRGTKEINIIILYI